MLYTEREREKEKWRKEIGERGSGEKRKGGEQREKREWEEMREEGSSGERGEGKISFIRKEE